MGLVFRYNLRKFNDEGKPTAQWGFSESRAKVQIMGGAFGNGKTTAVCMKALRCVSNYPGCTGLLARSTYPKLNDSLRKTFIKCCPRGWVKKYPTKDDNTIYFKNGSEVHFRYVAQKGKMQEDGTTTSNLLSNEYDFIVVDQLEDPEIEHKDFLDLAGRLRGQTPYKPADVDHDDPTMPSSGPRWMMLTLNPTHNWPYKELVQPILIYKKTKKKTDKLAVDMETGEPIAELYESSVYENKHNLPADYIKLNESLYKGQMRARYLMGEWAAFEGLVYETFDRRLNIITRERMMEHLNVCLKLHVDVRAIEGYDFGLVSPSCYLLGFVDHYGRVFILDGYYRAGFDYTEQPATIREIRAKYDRQLKYKNDIYADPAIFRRQVITGRKDGGTSLATVFKREYDLHMIPGTSDFTTGIAKVASYLNGTERTPALDREGSGPLLYFCEDLDFIPDEMETYFWKKNTHGQRIDEPQDGHDHSLDNLKYMLSKLPEASKIVLPMEECAKPWMRWGEMDLKEYARRANAR